MLLAVVLAGIAIGSPTVLFGLGSWSWLVLGLYFLSLYLLRRYEGRGRWQPVDLPDELHGEGEAEQTRPEKYDDQSTGQVLLRFAIGALLLLGAGFVVTRVAEALAGQTGLGTSFVGATLLAGVTSLPEVGTTISAVRLGAYSMAIANIFGSNALMVALVFLADVLYLEGPILQAVDRSSMFAALAGIVLTCVYLLGLIERRDKVVWRVGLDSAAVAMLYVGTLVMLYLSR
jgi:cation:H+ antiporter